MGNFALTKPSPRRDFSRSFSAYKWAVAAPCVHPVPLISKLSPGSVSRRSCRRLHLPRWATLLCSPPFFREERPSTCLTPRGCAAGSSHHHPSPLHLPAFHPMRRLLGTSRLQENISSTSSRLSPVMIFRKQQKQVKSLCVHGELEIAETAKSGSSNVMVAASAVKDSSTRPSKDTGIIETKEAEKQMNKNIRKKKGATKHNGKIQQSKAVVKKNQQSSSNQLDLLPTESKTSGDVNAKGKKIARKKKTTNTDASASSQQQLSAGVSKTGEREIRPLYPPSGKSVVVVESVTKAKIIQNYLGNMYEVVPSYGHVRDLAGRSGSVRPDDDFSMVWEVPASAWTHLKSIKVALSGAENLILASDPDREGEAIAWHIIEMLQQQDALSENINVARVVFHEITEGAIKDALRSPRDVDASLVNAYLTRRALDYLIGFSISPLLWRKLPGCQSAGRVQSAALSLICDREMEIDQFKSQEYWTVGVEFGTASGSSDNVPILSQLTYFNSQKLDQLSVSTHEQAEDIKRRLSLAEFKVLASKTSKIVRNPPMPYITSTLQQDSTNKLQFTVAYTMKNSLDDGPATWQVEAYSWRTIVQVMDMMKGVVEP
ncbi:hypothetical protein Taro_004205 [Colocasia esculenta]|uniref:DNA topoisomerase n=1 Tax=Colocasia esculenta TaxID=4460 RepID=A0A843TLG2_COLES|nr:hypothetical protein [Colocasia esculenta]